MTYGYCRICQKELTNETDIYMLTTFLTKPYVTNIPVNTGGSYLYCSDCVKHNVMFHLNAIPGMNFNLLEKDSNG